MSLREKIRKVGSEDDRYQNNLLNKFGIIENPFPAAGQPSGHPRLETEVDEKIIDSIREFERYHKTQVLLIEGTQGVGKTNLLNHYQNELEDLYQDDKNFYIIRYYPDPEPSFDAIIRRVFQELGENHLKRIATKLHDLTDIEKSTVIDTAKNSELRVVFYRLARSMAGNLETDTEVAMDWLLGLRVLNKHKGLGIKFRLDTVESKTQVLRDIIYISVKLGILKGIFLLLDELEKQDYSLSTTPVVRYLSAIRALIDALPTHLFLVMALTSEARRRYFVMLPAIAGRLQNVYLLSPLKNEEEALQLFDLYLQRGRERAVLAKERPKTGFDDIFEKQEIGKVFKELAQKSAQKGIRGVTQRDFLNELYVQAQERFKNLT